MKDEEDETQEEQSKIEEENNTFDVKAEKVDESAEEKQA